MKDATEIRVTIRAVAVEADVASTPLRLRTEIAAGIAEALARPAASAAERPRSIGTSVGARVGQAVAARLAEHGWADAPPGGARPRATSDGGRDGH